MDKALEQKYEELEKRVAALEGQAQPLESQDIKSELFSILNTASFLVNKALPMIISMDELFPHKLVEGVRMMENQEIREKPIQENQPPIREELNQNEKYKITRKIFSVFSENNLSIKQAKEIMTETVDALENIYPWNKK
ncbi:hypothetical protein [Clostridium kluyveri]|uniref:hypothetical protein n=1 Tax=Clostridium kluyveri TaxID=1534 RepID=UPI0002E78380|nr:hypothetical protein [Clostridium kluyveri]